MPHLGKALHKTIISSKFTELIRKRFCAVEEEIHLKLSTLLSEKSYHFQISSTAFSEYFLVLNKILKAVAGFI